MSFSALSPNLESLKTVLDRISDDIVILFQSEYGDFDLGTNTNVETKFKVLNDNLEYINPTGFLHNYRIKDDDNNVVSKRRVVTDDILFNVRNFSFCKSTIDNDTLDLSGQTLIINNVTITFTTESSFEEVITTIKDSNIINVDSYIDDGKLIIYSTKLSRNNDEYINLTLDGTSLPSLGLISGKFNNASCSFVIRGIKYDVLDYEDGVNNYAKYFYVSRR